MPRSAGARRGLALTGPIDAQQVGALAGEAHDVPLGAVHGDDEVAVGDATGERRHVEVASTPRLDATCDPRHVLE